MPLCLCANERTAIGILTRSVRATRAVSAARRAGASYFLARTCSTHQLDVSRSPITIEQVLSNLFCSVPAGKLLSVAPARRVPASVAKVDSEPSRKGGTEIEIVSASARASQSKVNNLSRSQLLCHTLAPHVR